MLDTNEMLNVNDFCTYGMSNNSLNDISVESFVHVHCKPASLKYYNVNQACLTFL